jgi:hypothetical protein
MIPIQELYTAYMNYCNEMQEPEFDLLVDDAHLNQLRPFTDQEFVWMLRNDEKFNAKWGPYSHNLMIQYLLEKEGDMVDSKRWKRLTKEQALFVKNLRVVEGYSWRSIARQFISEYKIDEQVTQLMGALLCEAARQVLEESAEDGWN